MILQIWLVIASLVLATVAAADPVQIPGPLGPLFGEAIAVANARHAVVIIPGSGPVNRDGNGPQLGLASNTYKMLAEGLAAHGIATIRVDKRGLFGSRAAILDPNNVTVAAYADDARRWVERAAELAPCVWIAGHSEGGLIALVAARTPPKHLCGLILLAAAGRPVGDLLREQMRAVPAMAPLMREIDATTAELEAGHAVDPGGLPPQLRPIFARGIQRYLIDVFAYDPVRIAAGWRGPVLIVQGDADRQVKPLDADLLAAALPQAHERMLAGATHMLKVSVPEQPFATYVDPGVPLHPDLIPAITEFLDQNPGPP
jgi:pimeloyl-ACP methyl ester carboxylesterase